MKIFLIIISILGAIVYGMLQINTYYDNKGACSWGLLSGGEYRHKERLDNAIAGLMKDIIKHDKNARRELLTREGKSQAEIDKVLKSLAPQYKKEKEKMEKYCYLDFDKEPYFQKKSMDVKPSDYCEVGTGNNVRDRGYGGFDIEYNFDKESLDFFNPTLYVVQRKDESYYLASRSGIKYDTGYFPCDTRYQGLGETGRILAKKTDVNIDTLDKTKPIKYLKAQNK